jgi:hypothetical protein
MRNYPVQILSVANTGSHTGSSYFVGQAAAASFTPVCGDSAAGGSGVIIITTYYNNGAVGTASNVSISRVGN